MSGISTVFAGFRIFEVSAMKCTPHCTIVGLNLGRLDRQMQAVADDIEMP